jgi:uncharacterized protein involved in exopolysaccharide biosynthesis
MMHSSQASTSWTVVFPQKRWLIYATLGFLINITFWSLALLYVKSAPRSYRSIMAVNLPGSTSQTRIDVPGVGGAFVENISPYASSQDPRENFKIIAESDEVLTLAAYQMKMTVDEFGSPRIKLVDGTTIMQLEFPGKTPAEARSKATAFYNAFEERLDQLRIQETLKREISFAATMRSSQEKLEFAQKRLSDYRAQSGLSSEEQIKELSTNIESLRKLRAEMSAEYRKADARSSQLASDSDLSAQEAAEAFTLQADALFQQTLKNLNEVSAGLVLLESRFTPNHPKVIQERVKQQEVSAALLSRAQLLLGRSVNQGYINKLNLNNLSDASAREVLLRELVTTQVNQRGTAAQIREMDYQIAQLETRLRHLTQLQSSIDALKRNMQIAEAVFSSTLTKLDVDRSNAYDSYPLMQMVSKPSLPKTPSSPKPKLILGGTALASLLLTSGLIAHWFYRTSKFRKSKSNLSLQSDSSSF